MKERQLLLVYPLYAEVMIWWIEKTNNFLPTIKMYFKLLYIYFVFYIIFTFLFKIHFVPMELFCFLSHQSRSLSCSSCCISVKLHLSQNHDFVAQFGFGSLMWGIFHMFCKRKKIGILDKLYQHFHLLYVNFGPKMWIYEWTADMLVNPLLRHFSPSHETKENRISEDSQSLFIPKDSKK